MLEARRCGTPLSGDPPSPLASRPPSLELLREFLLKCFFKFLCVHIAHLRGQLQGVRRGTCKLLETRTMQGLRTDADSR